jgi:hypothetical protein
MSRLQVFTLYGEPLASLNTKVVVDWALGGVGTIAFSLSLDEPKNRIEFMDFDHELLWTHDELPAWGGFLDTPRKWGTYQTHFQGYSGEALLDLRTTIENTLLRGTSGEMFRQLVAQANAEEDLGVREGSIWGDGPERAEKLGDTCLTHIKRIAQRAGNDFVLRPVLEDNKLLFYADWYERYGTVQPWMLEEGMHFELKDPTLVEDGLIVNRIRGLGDASTAKKRPVAVVEDAESRSRYRLRSRTYTFSGNTEIATVQANAEATLQSLRFPRDYLFINVIDASVRRQIGLGNIYPMRLFTGKYKAGGGFGMDGYYRVLGMRYDENDDVLELRGLVLTEI